MLRKIQAGSSHFNTACPLFYASLGEAHGLGVPKNECRQEYEGWDVACYWGGGGGGGGGRKGGGEGFFSLRRG